MAENDQWDQDPQSGDLLVAMLSGFATACAPDGSLAVLRLTYLGDEEAGAAGAVQLALRPAHVRDLNGRARRP